MMTNILPTETTLTLANQISDKVKGQAFHKHSHILLDIATQFFNPTQTINYVEIGAYAGASALLMMHRPFTSLVSVDIGRPIPPEVCIKNVERFNPNPDTTNWYYLTGTSHHPRIIESVMDMTEDHIDILYIDGDHSFDGVIEDWDNFSPGVAPQGFLIFDDYWDTQHSPQVKKAVDWIIENRDMDGWEIIGSIPNEWGAEPPLNGEGLNNLFIIRKN